MPFAGYKNFADCVAKNSKKSNPKAYCATIMRKTESTATYWERDFSSDRRSELAKSGKAMSDGSFPIVTVADLRNAIHAVGRAKNSEAAKRHIIKRAKALGKTDLLPADWSASTKKESVIEATDVFEGVQEAEFDDEKLEANITIIKAGRSKNGRHYGPKVLREAVSSGTFDNMRMFVDHSATIPLKRSLKEMVSATTKTEFVEDEKGPRIVSPVKFFNKDFYDFAKRAKEYMGNSINARLRTVAHRQADGSVYEDVQQIVRGHSVDWVIFPAAGGGIDNFVTESEAGDNPVENIAWSELTEDLLKENAPELYTQLTAKKESEPPEDPDEGDDDESVKLTKEDVTKLVQEALQAREQEAQEAEAITRQIAEAVDGAALPDVVKARLKTTIHMKKYDKDAVESQINEAKEELKKLGLGPKVTGMGVSGASSDTKPSYGSAQEAVRHVFGMDKPKKGEKDTAEAVVTGK